MKVILEHISKASLKNKPIELIVEELDRLGRNADLIKKELMWFKEHNIIVRILEIPTTLHEVDESNRWVTEMVTNLLIEVYAQLAQAELEKRAKRQAEGIAIAKLKGVYKGRKPIQIDNEQFVIIYTRWKANEITARQAMLELNIKTFNTTMSRGEYIYLLTKYIYGDTYAQRMEEAAKEDETLSDDLSLTNIKDAGNISLQDAINNVENGLPTDMYQTLSRAVALGFVTEDNLNWDEAITKSEAITLFIDAAEVYYNTTKSTSTTTDDNIVVDDTTSSFEIVEQGDYPDSRSDHQANWDIYKNYFDDFSVYGTDTAGKGLNDLPYGGDTGYDPKGTILQERTTDKGYTVMYDTDTGKVYYSSMILPTGDVYNEITSGKALVQYILDNDIFSVYDLTYSQFQEILGIYNGD